MVDCCKHFVSFTPSILFITSMYAQLHTAKLMILYNRQVKKYFVSLCLGGGINISNVLLIIYPGNKKIAVYNTTSKVSIVTIQTSKNKI